MLKAFLHGLKQKSVLNQTQAAHAVQASLGPEWAVSDEGLERTFKLPSYEHANNFMIRYNSYCEKLNAHPAWSNCYDTISVALKCRHTGEITTREVSIAKYLNVLHDVSWSMEDRIEADIVSDFTSRITLDGARSGSIPTPLVAHETQRLTE